MRDQKDLIKGATGDWEVIIGMEVHAQVLSKSKLFSGASAEFGGEPNDHVSLVDAAMPGMLPVINEFCVEQAVRTGLGLKAKINRHSVFDRKNYFYPDLPQGYQISQYKQPVVGEGRSSIDARAGDSRSRSASNGCISSRMPANRLHDQHPDHELRRSQPLRRRAHGDRLQARHALGRRGQGLCHQAAPDHALSRHLRRQHGAGLASRRRQCLGAPPGRAAWERAARSRMSIRSASWARRSSTRRAARSASSRTAARSIRKPAFSMPARAKPAPCAPRKRRMTTAISPIPISCRSNSTKLGSTRSRLACRNCLTTRRRAS